MSQSSSSLPAFGTSLHNADSNTSAVVFVWAAWDPVCAKLETALRQAQSDYPSLRLFGLDLDDGQNWPIARAWGVQDTRTLVCLVKGGFRELIILQSLDAPTKATLSAWNQLAEEQEGP